MATVAEKTPYEKMTREEILELQLGDTQEEIKRIRNLSPKEKLYELWAKDPSRLHPRDRPKGMPDYMAGHFKKVHIERFEFEDQVYQSLSVNEFPEVQLRKQSDLVLPIELVEALSHMNIERLKHIQQDDAKQPYVAVQELYTKVQFYVTGDATWQDWLDQKAAQAKLEDPRKYNKTTIKR